VVTAVVMPWEDRDLFGLARNHEINVYSSAGFRRHNLLHSCFLNATSRGPRAVFARRLRPHRIGCRARLCPVITKLDPQSEPILTLLVTGRFLGEGRITEIADKQVRRAIRTVDE